ncbi:MAG: CDGSH iron-sulfur domain-containing protein [Dehalococcoidia bacterium]|jgi:CDGSH-type Zn-finger protein|nr:CDGSH iron-sulfur domain-containing protein [Dehalococcoidia bacterium]
MSGAQKQSRQNVKVTENGPYLVSGGVPLSEQVIGVDADGQSHGWKEGKAYPAQEKYALCRCGRSRNKPYCDGTHVKVKFDGTEVASHTPYLEQASALNGPALTLTDAEDLCASARFCHRAGGTWQLTRESGNSESRQTAIEEACDCPSGRLVAWDKKDRRAFEPGFQPSIGLVDDTQAGKKGPIWVRGGIPVESADGAAYEVRNRVTLCRCGRSSNKPFCDGSHLD